MKKKLAIIGANYWQKPLFLKAREMNLETHCFSWEKDAVCKDLADYFYPISIFEKEQILEICQKIQIDGILSISIDIAVPTVWYVAEKMGLIGNKYEDALISPNKYLQRQAFSRNGVNIPRFTIADDKVDVTGFTYPLIVKPTDRGGSIGVTKVEKEEELKDAIELAQKLSFEKKAIVEEFVPGTEIIAVQCISWKGKHYFITIDDSEGLEGSYYKTAYHHPADMSDEDIQKAFSESCKALDALNFKYGASEVEVILSKDGDIKIIEVNPRMAGEAECIMAELATGYDFAKGAINIALNQFEEPVFPIKKCSGLYYLRKETEYLRPIIENNENDPEIIEAVVFNEKEAHLGRLGYFIYQSDRKRSWNL